MYPIRTFVRRHRKISFNQNNVFKKLWPKLGINFSSDPLSFDLIFGRSAPTILEIGFGTGSSLICMAKNNPNFNFLGVEVYLPGIISCLAAIQKNKIFNLRLIYHDVNLVLKKMLLNNSLYMVQIFFPDPWHKKKHNKRRIVQDWFSRIVLEKLEFGGILRIVTDWNAYAKQILNVIDEIPGYRILSNLHHVIPSSLFFRIQTKFESRGKKYGYKIFDLVFKKVSEI